MRVYSLLSFATILSFAATSAVAGTVSGKAEVVLGGQEARCVGVALVARTMDNERRIAGLFGTVDAASRPVAVEELLNVRAADYHRSREGRCSFRKGYRFTNVAPGDYFVTLLARGGKGRTGSFKSDNSPDLYESGFREQALLLMQPVRVSADGVMVAADFKHD